jgi:RNA polymerase sigma factor (sigma-70 family)
MDRFIDSSRFRHFEALSTCRPRSKSRIMRTSPLRMTKKGAKTEPRSPTSSEMMLRARGGDSRAISALFRRHGSALRRWARGRLPRWARTVNDTADIVQDVLLQTFRRMDQFEDRGKGALQAYLRQAVVNRIRDEMRRVTRRPSDDIDASVLEIPGREPSPLEMTLNAEEERRYKNGLATLTEDERLLVVGRMELHYNYAQLALISGRATPEAARLAVRRAVTKLAKRISSG